MTKLILALALVGQGAPGPDRAAPAPTASQPGGAAAPAQSPAQGPATSPAQAPAAAPSPAAPSATSEAATAPGAPVLTLEEAIREAHEKSLNLKVAQARLDQAHELSAKAWAGYLPTVAIAGSATRNDVEASLPMPTGYWIRDVPDLGTNGGNGPAAGTGTVPGSPTDYLLYPSGFETIVIQKRDQLAARATASQALIVPPLWAAIANAYKAEKVAELTTENARREIMFAVVQTYYGVVGLEQALAVQQRLLEATRAHERDARTRVNAGAAPKITLIRAEIDRAKAEQDVRRAQFSLASAKIALGTLVQHRGEFEVEQPPEPTVTADAESLQRAALQDRPDVLAARANVDLARGQHNGTWLSYLPSLVANGMYQKTNVKGFTGRDYAWSVTLAAQWTLFDGGLRESQLRETEAKLVEARNSATATEQQAVDEVRRSLLDLESARANRQKAEEQLSLARENMRLVEVNFNSGVATQLDVTDATTALSSAELGAVGERLNSQLAALRLLKAAGAFNP